MKQTEGYKQAQENMKPGVITSDGFLGKDSRPLADIIEADEEFAAKIGVDFDAMVHKMAALLNAGLKGLGEPTTVEGKWLVRTNDTRGVLPSPFPQDGVYHKINAEVELLKDGKPSGKKILYNELVIHLISKHHFLQGKGSPFRLELDAAKEVLGL